MLWKIPTVGSISIKSRIFEKKHCMILPIERVKPLSSYKLFIRFQDGVEGEVDLSHLAGKGVFQFWDDYANFEKVYIDPESGAISWNNMIDIDTLTIYAQLRNRSVEVN